MSSNSKDIEQMSSNDFWARDFFQKVSWDILRTYPGHVICPQMYPQILKTKDQAIAN